MEEERPIIEDSQGNIGVPINWEPVVAWFKEVDGSFQFLYLTTSAENCDVLNRINGADINKAIDKARKKVAQYKKQHISGVQLRLPL